MYHEANEASASRFVTSPDSFQGPRQSVHVVICFCKFFGRHGNHNWLRFISLSILILPPPYYRLGSTGVAAGMSGIWIRGNLKCIYSGFRGLYICSLKAFPCKGKLVLAVML